MGKRLRILFIGCFRYNCGSSHALLGYFRAAQHLGFDLRASILGQVDQSVQKKVPVAPADWIPDLGVMVFESEQFLSLADLSRIERIVPRSHRVIIDPDGNYLEIVRDGADTNHPTEESLHYWSAFYRQLSDTVLQPRLGPMEPGTQRFLYFGLDLHRPGDPRANSEKLYDLLYIGNNWYRWHDIVWLLGQLQTIRPKLGRIAIFGKDWFGETATGYEECTYSDPTMLEAHGVETYGSVPFDEVEPRMGQGKLHPIFIRPILNALKLITPRMFETFAADTVPILPPYFHHAAALYGEKVRPLCLPPNPNDSILSMLDNYSDYVCLAFEIRNELITAHSYESRLAELIGFCF